MLASRNLSRFLAALISLSLLFSASSSFAMAGCAQMAKMPTQSEMAMSAQMAMPMMNAADTGKLSPHKAPCKMPAGQCASLCAAMSGAALTPLQVGIAPSTLVSDATDGVNVLVQGITPPPALPPPISLV
jgi:hypothetical protein